MAAHLIICSSRVCSSGCEGKEKQAMENKNFTFQVLFQNSTLAPRMESQTRVVITLWQHNNLM